MTRVGRFAPSPTGRLHLGHALSAVLARDACDRLVLRIEDIDAARCRAEFVAGILDDLRWLGIAWDGPVVLQSTRAAAHADALERLQAMGLLYPCICTRAEIAACASAPHDQPAAIYPGTCRATPVASDDPRPVAWRLDGAAAVNRIVALGWVEEGKGFIAADARNGGDVVLARKGIGVAYNLAVVVDDAAVGVTDVVRGRDLSAATPVQRLLQTLLDLPAPRYRHHALVHGLDGCRLAKRTAGATLADLREAGTDPAALVAGLRAGRLPVGFTLGTA